MLRASHRLFGGGKRLGSQAVSKSKHLGNCDVRGGRNLLTEFDSAEDFIERCTVERLIRDVGIEGVRCGKKAKTTPGQPTEHCPLDKLNGQFRASTPNHLWVSDFTFVLT